VISAIISALAAAFKLAATWLGFARDKLLVALGASQERAKINADVQRILDEQTGAWGIKVSNVELKHIDLNETMVRAIAKQAEAERLRRAKVIDAEGEQQAAEKLTEAGAILSGQPEAMQLRYLGALQNIAGERSSTIVFPIPIDLFERFARATVAKSGS